MHFLNKYCSRSKPQVLKNCPVLGSRTTLFFEPLKFCWKTPETSRNICEDLFCFHQLEIAWKKILKTYFKEHLRLCPRPRAFLSLASRGSVLGRAVLGLGVGFFLCPWPWSRALRPQIHICCLFCKKFCKDIILFWCHESFKRWVAEFIKWIFADEANSGTRFEAPLYYLK